MPSTVAEQTCGHTRDLFPEVPGKVLLVCDRKPHVGGKHSRHREDGTVEAQWWGDRRG